MDRTKPLEPEQARADLAPETHNAEQGDHLDQAQDVAGEARYADAEASPLDSEKPDEPDEVMDDASQDLIDRMLDQEQSGRIDMSAYRGEPNMDDNEDKYGEENKLDDLRSDGT
jgi:hypothetical protein